MLLFYTFFSALLLASALLLCLLLPICDAMTITLDPGHSYSKPGAISCSGVGEVFFNDALAARLASALRKAGHIVRLTRKGEESPTLIQRAASAKGSSLLISLHHDSVQPQFLQQYTDSSGKDQLCSRHAAGYSVFVSRKNANPEHSIAIASIIAHSLRQAGFTPSLHHTEDVTGERKEFDSSLGIYYYDNLVVLKKSPVPALLIEVGVIKNPEEEKNLSDTNVMDAFSAGIVEAVSYK
jgi:N-acetylmuramoyl-L-alanine amidase